MTRVTASTDKALVFAHIGDLHITDAKQRNFNDFLSIAAQIEVECGKTLDFVVLPGDNADNGLPSQYALIAAGLKMVSVPVHMITGDHDMEKGSLASFYKILGAEQLPKSKIVRGVRCLFLDFCGFGKGGPDFRLGQSQLEWLTRELAHARAARQPTLFFMHSYPDDIKDEQEKDTLNNLIAESDVALVDMGHTHYNEIANDGRTIFAATRSTGQIEEGPPGYAIASYDNGVVSWRFKALDEGFPYVLITSPCDHRLMRHQQQKVSGRCVVRAHVFGGRKLASVECAISKRACAMNSKDGRLWETELDSPDQNLLTITVRATDDSGRIGQHTILAPGATYAVPHRTGRGSDAASVGAWPENGILGTQLGPNRNAKPFV